MYELHNWHPDLVISDDFFLEFYLYFSFESIQEFNKQSLIWEARQWLTFIIYYVFNIRKNDLDYRPMIIVCDK